MRYFVNITIALLISASTSAQIVSQWRGESRDGQYKNETGLLKSWPAEGPALLWSTKQLGKGYSSPALTKDGLYITGMENGTGYLYFFDHKGKLLWKTAYGNEWEESYPGSRCTPTVYQNQIFVLSGYGLLSCFHAKTGKEIWKNDLQKSFGARNIQWGFTESLLIADKKLIVTPGGPVSNLVALDPINGKTIWTSKALGELSAYCSPQYVEYNNKKIIVTHTANSVIGIELTTGKLLWSAPKSNTYSVHPNTPLYFDGKIFCSSGYGSESFLLKLSDDGTKITKEWSNQTLDNQMGGMIYSNGLIFGTGQEKTKTLHAIDAKTGKLRFSMPEWTRGNVIMADGMIYSYSEKGEVGLIKPSLFAFELKGKFRVTIGSEAHWAHPVIYNGVLYIRHGNALLAYSIKQN